MWISKSLKIKSTAAKPTENNAIYSGFQQETITGFHRCSQDEAKDVLRQN